MSSKYWLLFKRREFYLWIYAYAESRTRVYCLEGNYRKRWTTNAIQLYENQANFCETNTTRV